MSVLIKDVAPEVGLTAACEIDLHTFVREAWPTVVPAEAFQDNWHIGAICEHLEALADRELYNLLINISPRFGKSVLCSVMFPAWLWVKDPTMRMVYSSYGASLSTRDSVATRRLVESEWYRSRWADRYSITTDQNEKTRFENDKRGFRLSTSVGGVATGEGGDLVVVDDPHNVNEAESETVRKGVLDWWNVTMPSRTGRGGRSLRLVIMQRVHEEDLAGDIIKKGAYAHLCIPMEYEAANSKRGWNGWTDPRTEDGELAWKERFTAEVIASTLKPPHMSSYAYAGQFQQRPAPLEGGMFLRKWWKYYKIAPEALLLKADDKCWSWDMAFKDLKSSDFVAGTAWVRVGADFYLLPHTVHDKLGFSASRASVVSCSALWPIHAKLVEDKANGTAVVEDLQHTVPGLIAVDPRGGKESRASVMQPYAEAGNIHLPDPSVAAWVELFVEEFRVFPNGANDDWVDSSSQAITWLLDRMKRGFAPFTVGFNRSTSRQHDGESYRDPRSGEDPVLVPRRSDRGDERAADSVAHDADSEPHRSECRACRARWKGRST